MHPTESKPAVILNVNDDMASRYLVTKVLKKSGFEVMEAENGTAALRLARELPDLVILDVRLPDINGLEVCRRLKADAVTASIPVLHTSATFVTTERRVEGLEGGADGYLAQPFESVELVATVRALLRARRAEDSAHATAVELQATFDGITDGVCLLSEDGRVGRHNRAFHAFLALDQDGGPAQAEAQDGASDAPASGEGDDLLPPALRDLVQSILAGGPRAAEVVIRDRFLAVKCDPLDDGKGWVLIVADVTERRRLEEEERRSVEALAMEARQKDEFLAMLAHELRNPLNAISMALHLQGDIDPEDPRNPQIREMLGRQTAHLARLVDDLLDVSRLTRGKILLKQDSVDLVKTLAAATEVSRVNIDARRHTLSVEAPTSPVWVRGDAMRLEQVLVNLLNNAAKYSDPGRRIWLSLETEAGAAIMKVRDEGCGIAPEMQGAVFDLFRQESQALDRALGGLGVGLTIVRSLVEMHGGSVSVASPGRGLGAEFTVRLPLATATAQPARGAPAPEAGRSRPARVVVVEDNTDALEMMRMAIARAGHDVEAANDGVSGLELITSVRPEVALVDIGLPGLDGYQIAERTRSDPACRGVYLIALTGYGRPEDEDRALRAGFDLHVVKPVRTAQLLNLIDGARRARVG